jgi:hypothetical protein
MIKELDVVIIPAEDGMDDVNVIARNENNCMVFRRFCTCRKCAREILKIWKKSHPEADFSETARRIVNDF